MLFNQTLTYISLFSGAGVGRYGLLEEGFECVATNEILEKRLNIQRINRKCKLDESYISGDIKKPETKEKILKQIGFYSKKFGNDRVDLVVATPPCQGMSVANHKKKNDEIKRNSLVVESIDLIKQIKPRFFILENVPSFYKTGCIDKNDNLLEIGSMIEQNLSGDYMLYDEVINFKNFGANSSRTRTLVIGVCKEFKDFISALEFFPDFKQEKTLKEVIGSLKPLAWGEYDSTDFYHSFRTYPKHMQEWIKDLKEGQSAFENTELNKKPHRIVGSKIVLNVSKNGDKYKRQKYHSVAPCIHTRNDQMASQNTIHPKDDRVFSIRELMLLMNIPSRFKWLDLELQELNALNQQEKEKISKQNEMNIRQSIGEAVPTIIFKQIAIKIKNFMSQTHLEPKEIIRLIDVHHLLEPQNLKRFILENKNKIARASLASLAEMSNSKRIEKSAYFANPFIINEIAKLLPSFKQESVTIIEPSVGCGNFLSALFKKYASVKKVYLKCIKPEIFIIENVKNIISCAKGYFLEEIKERLNALGYQLSCQILNAKDYGVPQNRERAFIVGTSRFNFDFNLLEPSQSVNVQDAISDLAYLCSNEGAFESDYLNPIQSSYQALMRKNSPKLYNHQATNHSQAALEKLKLINKEQGKECLPKNLHGKQQFKSTWGRLNWNKISPTIDTRFDTPSNGTNSHPELHRSITPREAARIQSFSDNYIFYGNKTSVCKQIGNAVPPLLALALGKAILKSLRK